MKYIILITLIALFPAANGLSAEYSDYTHEQWQKYFWGFLIHDIYREGENVVWIAGTLTLKDMPTLTRYDDTGFTTWFLGTQKKNFQYISIIGPAHVRIIIDEQTNEFIEYQLLDGQWTVDDGDDSWSTETPPNDGILEQSGFILPLMPGNEWKYEREFFLISEFSRTKHYDRVIDTVIRWKQEDDAISYQLLSGTTYTQHADGAITNFDFRPCGEVECTQYGDYQIALFKYRSQGTVTVPAGTYNVYSFYVGDIQGSSCALASGIGQVEYHWVTDISYIEKEEWKLESASVNGVNVLVEEQDIPRVIETHIFPNPFNPATTIVFTLPETNHTRLTVYNFVGQNVKTLVDAPVSAGTHQVVFDGSDFSSGMYFYHIESGQYVSNGRMVLVK